MTSTDYFIDQITDSGSDPRVLIQRRLMGERGGLKASSDPSGDTHEVIFKALNSTRSDDFIQAVNSSFKQILSDLSLSADPLADTWGDDFDTDRLVLSKICDVLVHTDHGLIDESIYRYYILDIIHKVGRVYEGEFLLDEKNIDPDKCVTLFKDVLRAFIEYKPDHYIARVYGPSLVGSARKELRIAIGDTYSEVLPTEYVNNILPTYLSELRSTHNSSQYTVDDELEAIRNQITTAVLSGSLESTTIQRSCRNIFNKFSVGTEFPFKVRKTVISALRFAGVRSSIIIGLDNQFWGEVWSNKETQYFDILTRTFDNFLDNGSTPNVNGVIHINSLPYAENVFLLILSDICEYFTSPGSRARLELIDVDWDDVVNGIRSERLDMAIYNDDLIYQSEKLFATEREQVDVRKTRYCVMSFSKYGLVASAQYVRDVLKSTGGEIYSEIAGCYDSPNAFEDLSRLARAQLLKNAQVGVNANTDLETEAQQYISQVKEDMGCSCELTPYTNIQQLIYDLCDNKIDLACVGASESSYLVNDFSDRVIGLEWIDIGDPTSVRFWFRKDSTSPVSLVSNYWDNVVRFWEDTLSDLENNNPNLNFYRVSLLSRLNNSLPTSNINRFSDLVDIIDRHDILYTIEEQSREVSSEHESQMETIKI